MPWEAAPPGNRLEALRGDRQGQHSVRINGQRLSDCLEHHADLVADFVHALEVHLYPDQRHMPVGDRGKHPPF